MKQLLFLALFAFCTLAASAQNMAKMNAWQDSLILLSNQMYNSASDAERMDSNFKFVKTLVSSLKETNAFFYGFQQLKNISILNSPDNAFRIFSWNIPLEDGSYLYYGSIQYQGATLKLTPFLDKTFEIKAVDTATLQPNNWYGAQYYDIIKLSAQHYILLGWKGHHADYSKKIIEILALSPQGEVFFGAPVFTDNPEARRKIFSYTKQASMYLKYNRNLNRIEFDHIVPADPSLKMNYKYYGPDLTFDGYRIKDNKLDFIENINLQNKYSGSDKEYLDPIQPKSKLKSGIK